jgi:hypothetical protein
MAHLRLRAAWIHQLQEEVVAVKEIEEAVAVDHLPHQDEGSWAGRLEGWVGCGVG